MTNCVRIYFLLIAISIAACYSNTLHSPWHLDDPPNIAQNPSIQLNKLNIESIRKIFSAAPFTGQFSRPFSYFTLAVNYYFGQESTFGYHIVNIAIHLLTSLALFKTILLLFQTRRLISQYTYNEKCLIAFLSTIIWAVHPIQIQAITYIVQRMASLAALFTICSIHWFLKSFLVNQTSLRIRYIAYTLICFLLAILSKENPVLLPFSLTFLYIGFLGDDKRPFSIHTFTALKLISLFLIVAGFYYLYSHGHISSLLSLSPYGNRPFSLYERLLTESRILILYISLLCYPIPTRFSVDYSIVLSTSPFTPWTTLPAIVLLSSAFVIGLILIKRKPLIGFPILFFLLNHIVESSILPLELIFEHRNYLPSLFFFMPLALFINYCIRKYRKSSSILYGFTLFSTVTLILLLCWSTFARNTKWSSEELLWMDAASKAPNNARPYSYLGRIYGWEKEKSPENMQRAIDYYRKALGKIAPLQSIDGLLLANIGGIYLNYNIYDKSYSSYIKAVELDPERSKIRFGLSQASLLNGKFQEAFDNIDYSLRNGVDERKLSRYLNLRGLILLWQGKPKQALGDFKKAINSTNQRTRYYYNTGVALSHTGDYKQAKKLFQAALKDTPDDIFIMLSIIENEIRYSYFQNAEKYAQNLYSVYDRKRIFNALEDKGVERYRMAPIDLALIRPTILAAAKHARKESDDSKENK